MAEATQTSPGLYPVIRRRRIPLAVVEEEVFGKTTIKTEVRIAQPTEEQKKQASEPEAPKVDKTEVLEPSKKRK